MHQLSIVSFSHSQIPVFLLAAQAEPTGSVTYHCAPHGKHRVPGSVDLLVLDRTYQVIVCMNGSPCIKRKSNNPEGSFVGGWYEPVDPVAMIDRVAWVCRVRVYPVSVR